jgi:hypothetical protein
MGIGKWENGRRNLGRDEMGKGRRREKRDKGTWTSTFYNVIKLTSSLFFFGVWYGWNAGRSCWTAVTVGGKFL